MTDPLDHVEQLSAWLKDTGIGLFELRGPAGTLRLLNDGMSVQVSKVDKAERAPARTISVRAPSLGIFLDRHPLHEHAVAPIGADVAAGEPLGFLQVGPLLTSVPAPQAGNIIEVLVEHGAIVGYGVPLLELEPIEGEATP